MESQNVKIFFSLITNEVIQFLKVPLLYKDTYVPMSVLCMSIIVYVCNTSA